MKRFLCAALALLMLTALAACGSGSKDADASAKNDPTAVPTAAPTPEPTPEPTAAPEETSAPGGAISGDELFGTVSGDAYENRFLGIGCRLPGWHYLSQEEIAEQYNLAKYICSDDVTELLENNPATTVMFASSEDGQRNINIQVQNLRLSFGGVYSEEQILNIYVPMLENMLTQAGYTDLSIERGTVRFLGSERSCITITGKIYGIDIRQKQLFIFRDKYASFITFTGMSGTDVDDLIAAFYSIV